MVDERMSQIKGGIVALDELTKKIDVKISICEKGDHMNGELFAYRDVKTLIQSMQTYLVKLGNEVTTETTVRQGIGASRGGSIQANTGLTSDCPFTAEELEIIGNPALKNKYKRR